MPRSVRIGNAQAFWGDRCTAAAELLSCEPELDFVTLDYLAEVSMSILAAQRQRDPQLGYANDFVDVVRSLVPYWASGGRCRLITNAGGLNPSGCAKACQQVIETTGCRSLRIGIVSGDDVLSTLTSTAAGHEIDPFTNLDSGESLAGSVDRLVTANAYLGADPITRALADGADIVITGRVADPSMVVAACVHHFGWDEEDLDRLAGATVAGHLIECGPQVTGGICTDWLEVPDVTHLAFPIVEVVEDGACTVTKPQHCGGKVTQWTVKEQLVYEIGDPENYLSPDVTVSFCGLRVEEVGENRVRVSGAIGKPRPTRYKVSATLRDGFRSAGTLTIVGRDARAKALRSGDIVLSRLRESGVQVRDSLIECLGANACLSDVTGMKCKHDASSFDEVVLRVAVEVDSHSDAVQFSREMMPLITAGPQGTTGYAEGRPRIHPVIRYWPCLISRDDVTPKVELLQTQSTDSTSTTKFDWATCAGSATAMGSQPNSGIRSEKQAASSVVTSEAPVHPCLYDIALARSGDKGTGANIGVIPRRHADWPFLKDWLTSERVASFFSGRAIEGVERFELPNLHALNFVIRGILKQGLRTDAQGKTLGQILLEMPLPKQDSTKNTPEDVNKHHG
ncbi:acyclic terpene utilization AtuA family protein [Novipirellula sp. SH528]|uniref:acyclic terpene utilization AtuA family protein n=1 Tax=Novipirellula sp. SH528 TaxID=3454466 RepID=UPI003F9F6507